MTADEWRTSDQRMSRIDWKLVSDGASLFERKATDSDATLHANTQSGKAISKLDAIRDFINGQTKHNCGLIRTLKEMLNEN